MLALSNEKSTFVLVSGFFGCCIVTILFKYHSKGPFFTIITILMLNYVKLKKKNGFFEKLMQTKVATE